MKRPRPDAGNDPLPIPRGDDGPVDGTAVAGVVDGGRDHGPDAPRRQGYHAQSPALIPAGVEGGMLVPTFDPRDAGPDGADPGRWMTREDLAVHRMDARRNLVEWLLTHKTAADRDRALVFVGVLMGARNAPRSQRAMADMLGISLGRVNAVYRTFIAELRRNGEPAERRRQG